MGLNFLTILSQFNQFQQMLNSSGQNPKDLFDQELRKRNISPDKLQELINQAKTMSKLFGLK